MILRMNRHRALAYCLSIIYAQTRSAFVARKNRCPLCANAALRVRIMLYRNPFGRVKQGVRARSSCNDVAAAVGERGHEPNLNFILICFGP
jgi:hypothetical protein